MSIVLRDYQREAIDTLYAWFSENTGNPLIVIPTAGGKSLVIAQFIREAMEFPDTRILVVTHIKELIAQNYAEMVGLWPDAPAGIYSAGLGKRDIGARVIFAGIQSIHNRAYGLQKIDLVLVDEAHLIPRSADTMYGRFLSQLRDINPYLKVVGFTATPYRLDSGRLDRGEGAIFQEIAYEANIRDLIDAGYLCPPVSAGAVAQIDTAGIKTRAGDFMAAPLEASAVDPQTVAAIADEMVRHGTSRRGWLFFGCGLDHCGLMRDALRERGITCETIFGSTPSEERARTIAAFKRQEIRCLSSMGVLTTGFNARHVDLIGVGRPTQSTGLWVQMVGRGTRLFPGKTDCLVLDFGGNIARHGPVDKPKPKNEPGGGVMEGDEDAAPPQKICPSCGTVHAIAARECTVCGMPFPMLTAQVSLTPAVEDILHRIKPPEWCDVTGVSYRAHPKRGKPDSLCVSYQCGLTTHREWVCLEHPGGARVRAAEWWRKRAPSVAVPDTIAEALANIGALAKPSRVLVREAGKFTEVVGVAF